MFRRRGAIITQSPSYLRLMMEPCRRNMWKFLKLMYSL